MPWGKTKKRTSSCSGNESRRCAGDGGSGGSVGDGDPEGGCESVHHGG